MPRVYFTMLFIVLFTGLYIALAYFIPEEKLSNFIVVWVLVSFYAGQYSMRYPKK